MKKTIYLEDDKKATPACFIHEFGGDESSCLDML
jgi:uncharacterized alpha/beta hydrolase family protein